MTATDSSRSAHADMQRCVEHCTECHRSCTETMVHCLDRGGDHAESQHIRTLLDCADICATSARFMLRHAPQHGELCAICADVCDACADECERFGDDPTMQACAEVCRRCAESCRDMSSGLAGFAQSSESVSA